MQFQAKPRTRCGCSKQLIQGELRPQSSIRLSRHYHNPGINLIRCSLASKGIKGIKGICPETTPPMDHGLNPVVPWSQPE